MNEEIAKACEGIEYDCDGLLESDEILRSEVINHKVDYLTDVIKALVQLIVDIRVKDMRAAVDKYNTIASDKLKESSKKIAHAIEQYKERKSE